MEINLTLTLEEVNGIIGILSLLPFNQVNDLLQRVRNQAIVQVQAAQAKEDAEQVETLTPEA